MADFTIIRVSSAPPSEWSFDDRRNGGKVLMETYKVMLEGESDPITLNRKAGDKPAVGEIVSGTIEDTDYGKKFKKEPKQNNNFKPKDTAEIKAEWAIGQAASLVGKLDNVAIETEAALLFEMVDRIKTSPTPVTGYEKAKAQAEKIKSKQTFSDGSPVDEIFPISEEINLDDIPF